MHKLAFLTEHCSIPAKQLTDPAPSDETLKCILQSAMSVPDHCELKPFRFLVIQGEAREELSKVFEAAARKRGVDETVVLKQKQKPLRSPLIVTVIARVTENPAVPEIEQILSAGCAAQHIQLACAALDFGSIWLSGENCYDLLVYEALGLDINERIIGFIYIGTPADNFANKTRSNAELITHFWKTSQHTDYAI